MKNCSRKDIIMGLSKFEYMVKACDETTCSYKSLEMIDGYGNCLLSAIRYSEVKNKLSFINDVLNIMMELDFKIAYHKFEF